MRAIFSAIAQAWASLSITHGPAIRKSGFPAPKRSAPNAISCAGCGLMRPTQFQVFVPCRILKITRRPQAQVLAVAVRSSRWVYGSVVQPQGGAEPVTCKFVGNLT